MFKWITLLMVCSATASMQAQQSLADSLRKDIDRYPTSDSVRADAIVKYLNAGVNDRRNDFLPFTNELIHISKIIHYDRGLNKGYALAMIYYGNVAQYGKSIIYGDSAFEMLRGDTTSRGLHAKASLLNNRGLVLSEIGDYKKALDDFLSSAKISETQNDPLMVQTFINISEVYANMNLQEQSDEYIHKALNIAEQQHNDDLLCVTLLSNSSNLLMRDENADRAAMILERCAPMVDRLANNYYRQLYSLNRGLLFEARHDYPNALMNYQHSFKLAVQNNDPFEQCSVLNQLIGCYRKMKDTKNEKRMLDSLLLMSSNYALKYFKNQSYKGLATWYRSAGQFAMADKYMQQFVLLNDTIASEKIVTEISNAEGKYRLAQKDAQINELKSASLLQEFSIRQKRWLTYFLAGSAIVLSFMLVMIFVNYKQKQKLQQQQITELLLEKKITTTEAILKGEEKERTRIAKDLHDGLSGMLSGVKYSLQNMQGNLIMTPDNQQSFDRSLDMLDNSIKEMRRVAQNMMPEALVRFGLDAALADFAAEINRTGIINTIYESMGLENKNIEQSRAIIIYRIIQELVNNVVKHAKAKELFIQLLAQNDKLIVNVDDNGIGFDKSILENNCGMGWKNILTRVEYLKGTIDVKTETGKGTSVNIELSLNA
jgi:two-component system, NarL family, sensor kinase